MVVRVALLLLVALAAPVHAGSHDATFAKAFGVSLSQIHDVADYQLPPGDMTHVVIGRYDHGDHVRTGALLMSCTATECEWRRIEFGAADSVEIDGVVDLHGAPRALPARPLPRGTRISGRAMKFPAAVFRTRESKRATGETRARRKVEGTETRVKLYLVSLVEADRGSVVLMDTAEQRSPTGRGFARSYRLDRPDGAKGVALDLIATERATLDRDSRCRAPEPAETIHALDERHFRTKKVTPSKGC